MGAISNFAALHNLKRLTLNVRQRIKLTKSSLEVLEGLAIETLHI